MITVAFYLLFIIVPLILTPWNFELFEFNKMLTVYALTLVIAGAWAVEGVHREVPPLDVHHLSVGPQDEVAWAAGGRGDRQLRRGQDHVRNRYSVGYSRSRHGPFDLCRRNVEVLKLLWKQKSRQCYPAAFFIGAPGRAHILGGERPLSGTSLVVSTGALYRKHAER